MQQVHTAKTRRLSRATNTHSGDERARDDRTRDGSCRRARRPDALRKLWARETTGGTTEAVDARKAALGPAGGARPARKCRTSREPAGPRDKRAQERTESDKR